MATVDLSMQYIASVRDRVVVHATCTRRGRQLTFVDVTAVGPDGQLVARGLVTVRVSQGDA
jgi:acyl-coenzyme A thioesterase PaaI-like protein